jgi:hypothetical protein
MAAVINNHVSDVPLAALGGEATVLRTEDGSVTIDTATWDDVGTIQEQLPNGATAFTFFDPTVVTAEGSTDGGSGTSGDTGTPGSSNDASRSESTSGRASDRRRSIDGDSSADSRRREDFGIANPDFGELLWLPLNPVVPRSEPSSMPFGQPGSFEGRFPGGERLSFEAEDEIGRFGWGSAVQNVQTASACRSFN